MWFDKSVFYQFYPLGLCGAPKQNNGKTSHNILNISKWIPHIGALGANAVYFCPVFESDAHGYDTRDYSKIDCRLGTNEDFASVCADFHKADIKVVLDGVFNHVGRGFFAFKDVLEKREASPYASWFNINFAGNSNYNDGLWYEGWEGHYELVKLNLKNDDVVNYLFDCVKKWVDEFDIDGLRLDVAYCLDENFLRRLRQFVTSLKPDFFLLGEMLHGDYNRMVNDQMLHSCTNYECYKGLHSSFNSMNMFEIGHSIARQFGPENWTLYKGKNLFNFVDNHDVSRIASILSNENHLVPIYGLAFAMPGIPCVYYGSEWGIKGDKKDGDDALRPCIDMPIQTELTQIIAKMAQARTTQKALCYGNYKMLVLTNHQYIFEREFEGERVMVAINAADSEYTAHFNANAGCATDLITGNYHDFGSGSVLPPYSVQFWKI